MFTYDLVVVFGLDYIYLYDLAKVYLFVINSRIVALKN